MFFLRRIPIIPLFQHSINPSADYFSWGKAPELPYNQQVTKMYATKLSKLQSSICILISSPFCLARKRDLGRNRAKPINSTKRFEIWWGILLETLTKGEKISA